MNLKIIQYLLLCAFVILAGLTLKDLLFPSYKLILIEGKKGTFKISQDRFHELIDTNEVTIKCGEEGSITTTYTLTQQNTALLKGDWNELEPSAIECK